MERLYSEVYEEEEEEGEAGSDNEEEDEEEGEEGEEEESVGEEELDENEEGSIMFSNTTEYEPMSYVPLFVYR